MKVQIVLSICVAVLNLASPSLPAMARYDDFKVYKVFVKDGEQLNGFKELFKNLPLRLLNDISGPGRNYEVVIDAANQKALKNLLSYNGFDFECTVENLQQILEQSLPTNSGESNLTWTKYHGLNDIYGWLDSLVANNRFLVKPITIGYSYEGRPIKGITISARPGNKAIFIESNIHAIEWISSATSTCFIDNLLNSNDIEMKFLLSNYDWIFVPVLNPDGFEYSHNVERLWRKNRKPTGFSNSSGICYGVDLNRNFDYIWGGSGYNIDVPCDHWYGGAKANSEPEVQALTSYISSLPKKYVRMYLAFHSYGNLVLLPYGHTNEVFPPNYDQMMRIAKAFADAAKVPYGTEFRSGASGLLNYPVSGASKDWAYGVKGIPFTATIELRDNATRYGFFLPASQIVEVCEEVTEGLIAMIKRATLEGLFLF